MLPNAKPHLQSNNIAALQHFKPALSVSVKMHSLACFLLGSCGTFTLWNIVAIIRMEIECS